MSLSKEYTKEEMNALELNAKKFHDAIFSNPIDENCIIDLFSNTTNEERQLIRNFYKLLYKTPVQNDINSKLEDNLKELAINMFDTAYEYDAKELHKALSNPEEYNDIIVEIFCSRPKAHFEIVEKAYYKFYKKSLRVDILKNIPKKYAEFLFALMDTERPIDQTISGNESYENAKEMIKIGLKEFGNDVNIFQKIFIESSREDLILISRAYYEYTQKDIYDEVEESVEGEMKEILKGIIFAVITPSQFFSSKLVKEFENQGINSPTILRILISRAEIDMYAIRDYFEMETNTELASRFEEENPSAYSQILANLSNK